MFTLFITSALSWLPLPLKLLVTAVVILFFVALLLRIVKVVVELVKLVMDVFSIAISKVVGWLL